MLALSKFRLCTYLGADPGGVPRVPWNPILCLVVRETHTNFLSLNQPKLTILKVVFTIQQHPTTVYIHSPTLLLVSVNLHNTSPFTLNHVIWWALFRFRAIFC